MELIIRGGGRERSSKDAFVLGIIVLAVVLAAVFYWFQGPSPKEATQGTSLEAGFFTTAASPGELVFVRGNKAEGEARIMVIPLEGFKGVVSFRVKDIVKNGTSIGENTGLAAKFLTPTLSAVSFETGTSLRVSTSPSLESGVYVVLYEAKSREVTKHLVFPVSIK